MGFSDLRNLRYSSDVLIRTFVSFASVASKVPFCELSKHRTEQEKL